jgi:predicted permease
MHTLINSVLPVFFIVGIGYFARKTRIFKAQWINALIGYVYYIALPALIVTSIVKLDFNNSDTGQVLLLNGAILIGNALLCLLLMWVARIKAKDKAVFFLAATVGNSVYLGIPLTASALGVSVGTSDYALLVMIGALQVVGSIFIALLVNEFLFVGNKSISTIVIRLAKNPLVIAMGIGLLLRALSLPVDINDIFITPLSMLAVSASPVALFVLGTYLYGHAFKANMYEIGVVTIWKLVALPLIVFGVLSVFHVSVFSSNALILYAGMPTAVSALIIAKSYGFNTNFIAAAILVSTNVSLVTLSGIIIFLGL